MRSILLILSALALVACTQSLPPQSGTPSSGTSTPPITSLPSPTPTPAPSPSPAPPPAADPAACHAQLHWQAWYGQPGRTIITLGPACRGSQQVQIGLFARLGDQYPTATTGDTLWVNQHEVTGYSGYIVRTRLKLSEGQYTPWYNDDRAGLLNDGSTANAFR